MIEEGQKLTVVEAKASQTVTPELVNAGRQVVETFPETAQVSRIVVYGGEADQKRTDVEVLSWNSLDERRW